MHNQSFKSVKDLHLSYFVNRNYLFVLAICFHNFFIIRQAKLYKKFEGGTVKAKPELHLKVFCDT